MSPRSFDQFMAEVRDESQFKDAVLETANWIIDTLAPSFGPNGGAKLMAQDDHYIWVSSGATALRETAATGPLVAPYRRIVESVQRFTGDQATTACLLAARLVKNALTGPAPRAAYIQGYQSAMRQALAIVSAHAEDSGKEVLDSVVSGGAQIVANWTPPERLDDVFVTAHDGPLTWADGVVLDKDKLPGIKGKQVVALLATGRRLKPENAGLALRSPAAATLFLEQEEQQIAAALAKLRRLGITTIFCGGDLVWADRARAHGFHVQLDCGKDLLHRLAAATEAEIVHDLDRLEVQHLGHGAALQGNQLILTGNGPAYCLLVPGIGVKIPAAIDAGERLLRAAGTWWNDKRAVQGGGMWQQLVADNLRQSHAALPGKEGYAWLAAADAFREMVADLAQNSGAKRIDAKPVTGVLDLYAAVSLAIKCAFEAAIQILRIDGAYAKSPSTSAGLTGGGPIGPGSGIPTDVPPLM